MIDPDELEPPRDRVTADDPARITDKLPPKPDGDAEFAEAVKRDEGDDAFALVTLGELRGFFATINKRFDDQGRDIEAIKASLASLEGVGGELVSIRDHLAAQAGLRDSLHEATNAFLRVEAQQRRTADIQRETANKLESIELEQKRTHVNGSGSAGETEQ